MMLIIKCVESFFKSISKPLTLGALLLLALPSSSSAYSIDTEELASRIAVSLQKIASPDYQTLAISRIKKRNSNAEPNIDELIDYINVKIVRSRRFQVTDRSKLQLILKEQRIQLSEFVSPNEYKELGKILGVHLFVYGTLYNDSLVLKAIDVQNSVIAWAQVFPLTDLSTQHDLLESLGDQLITSLNQDLDRIQEQNVRQLSFWDLDVVGFAKEQVMDYLTAALGKEQYFRIVDRENLQLIFQEQKLNQSDFINEDQARRLGELYGVDAFLYGTISPRDDQEYIASLKMISIHNGVILWADLIKFRLPEKQQATKLINPFEKKIQRRMKKKEAQNRMVLIPAGSFVMGSNDPLYDSSPEHVRPSKAFMMDMYEVSNYEYEVFVIKTNHRIPTNWINGSYDPEFRDHPVTGIGWEDARLYCEHLGKRLPSEVEWERAARGLKGRRYPWSGPNFSPSFAITHESGAKQSVPVYTRNQDVTPEGVRHLVGNVREYVSDYHNPYPGSSKQVSPYHNERVIRGSSWAYGAYEAVSFYRGHSKPNLAWPDVGFRCAKSS